MLVQDIRGPQGAEVDEVSQGEDGDEVAGEGGALGHLNSQLGQPLSKGEASVLQQRALSRMIDEEAASRLAETVTEPRDKARLNCVARDGAGDWLAALPSKALGLHLRRL